MLWYFSIQYCGTVQRIWMPPYTVDAIGHCSMYCQWANSTDDWRLRREFGIDEKRNYSAAIWHCFDISMHVTVINENQYNISFIFADAIHWPPLHILSIFESKNVQRALASVHCCIFNYFQVAIVLIWHLDFVYLLFGWVNSVSTMYLLMRIFRQYLICLYSYKSSMCSLQHSNKIRLLFIADTMF